MKTYRIFSPVSGTVVLRNLPPEGRHVEIGTIAFVVSDPDGGFHECSALQAGRVHEVKAEEGQTVIAGEELALIT